MGTIWKVKIVDKIEEFELGHCYGTCDKHNQIIEIAKTFKDMACTEEQMINVWLHELTHAVLFMIGEHDLNGNERFIESYSGLLTEALTTAK